jgi:ABC-type multidrug transport system fused ATPase/permease subunit
MNAETYTVVHCVTNNQDPVMFTGSLLDNLDPFRERSERDVWKALETVSPYIIANCSYLQR